MSFMEPFKKAITSFIKVVNKIPTEELKINAKFIHLWILEDNDWKLKRVFSFDHQKAIKN